MNPTLPASQLREQASRWFANLEVFREQARKHLCSYDVPAIVLAVGFVRLSMPHSRGLGPDGVWSLVPIETVPSEVVFELLCPRKYDPRFETAVRRELPPEFADVVIAAWRQIGGTDSPPWAAS